jgi:hypothetical protein
LTTIALLTALLAAGPDDAKLTELADAYAANRLSFTNLDCRFEVRFGDCATLDDALAGRFTKDPMVRVARWTVRGPLERYRFGRSTDPTHPPDPKWVSFAPSSEEIYFLTSGEYVLSRGEIRDAVSIQPRADIDGFGIVLSPFNIGTLGPFESSNPVVSLEHCLSGDLVGTYGGTETINGVEVETWSIGVPGQELRKKYGFDPQRGHLLAYMHDTDTRYRRLAYSAYMTDARECSGGRWIPTRLVKIEPYSPEGPYRTIILTVTELNVDDPVPDDALSQVIPFGTLVRMHGLQVAWSLENDLPVAAADLPVHYDAFMKEGRSIQRRAAFGRFFSSLQTNLAMPWSGRTWGMIAIVGIVALLTAWWSRRSNRGVGRAE